MADARVRAGRAHAGDDGDPVAVDRAVEAGARIRERARAGRERSGEFPFFDGDGREWMLMRRVGGSCVQADSLGRGVYVVTTDAYRFYERLGYKLVGEVWIGDGNPRWQGPAAAIRLVSDAMPLVTKEHC